MEYATISLVLFHFSINANLGFIRAVAFHLQVCWEMVLGEWFMWGALICGWGIPAAGFTVMMVLTGTSFRFGQVCHININNSVHDFWIPILAISGAAIVFQLATMAYCIHIYIRTLVNQAPSTDCEGLPTYHASARHINARKAYRRIRKVFRLQWRGVAIVFIIIVNALYFAIVFINLDKSTKNTQENFKKALPWLVCLSLSEADKEKCRRFSQGLGPNEVTLLAVLILLALVGLWNFLLFVRGSLFIGWAELLKNLLCCCFHRRRKEFVSVDARTLLPSSPDARTYEMLYNNNNNTPQKSYKSPEPMTPSPTVDRVSGSKGLEAQASFDDHGWGASDAGDMKRSLSQKQQQLLQRNPSAASTNFSIPRRPAPSATVWEGREWDPRATFAPGWDPK